MVPARPVIGITIGDPAGIGSEVALRAVLEARNEASFVLFGPEHLWNHACAHLANAMPEERPAIVAAFARCRIVDTEDPDLGGPVEKGRTSARCGRIARAAVERAVEMALSGEIDAVSTAPLAKEGLSLAGLSWPGHTEMLRDFCGAKDSTMAFVGGGLTLALTTIHVPLRQVFDLLTPGLILQKARHLHEFLSAGQQNPPRIAVCGLNPHASEGGLFGDEEEKIITPAIRMAEDEGMALHGPFPADTIFYEARQGLYDGVLAMYHDQGLIALKTVAFDSAVNLTLGLPIIRTSPDHGTAFNIAGQGIARPGSMIAAVQLAIELARRRSARNA